MLNKENFEPIGTLGRSHGLSGEISARLNVDISALWGDEDERLFLMVEENSLLIPFRVEGLRSKAGDIDIIKFVGIDSKEAAESWSNSPVWLDKDYLCADESDEEDLGFAHFVGYTLRDAATDQVVGRITAVDESTLNTLLVVERADMADEVFVPIADELLIGINVEKKEIALTIPVGLLDDTAEYDIH